MANGIDWDRTKKLIRPHLQSGEPAQVFAAWIPATHDYAGLTFIGFLPLILVLQYLTNLSVRRKASRTAGVPLATRMFLALSQRRLIVFRATRRWRFRDLHGELPVDRIGSAVVSGSGSRHRSVTLHLKAGGTLSLMMPASHATRFAEHLAEVLNPAR